MPRAGPKRLLRYSLEFKRKAVRLTQLAGMQVQTVAKALDIHPFMLSRWRREARDGTLRGVESTASPKMPPLREIKRLQRLEREHALLKQEHELLKKAIRFCCTRSQTSSGSSTTKGTASR
jgi:transposase